MGVGVWALGTFQTGVEGKKVKQITEKKKERRSECKIEEWVGHYHGENVEQWFLGR